VPNCHAIICNRVSHSFSRVRAAFGHVQSAIRSAGALLRKEKHMVTIKVKDGTPEGGQSLCTTCRWAHIVKGFGVSQEKIHCCWLAYNPPVPFPVSQCSSYDDKRIPSKRDMEKIAWILMTKKAGRTIGFVTAKQFREIEGDDAEIIPAAAGSTEARE
jgi:hypothetical protein